MRRIEPDLAWSLIKDTAEGILALLAGVDAAVSSDDRTESTALCSWSLVAHAVTEKPLSHISVSMSRLKKARLSGEHAVQGDRRFMTCC